MTPLDQPSWSRFFQEFRCPGCGPQEAIRSRPRGFFERYVLPFLLLQTVRCERCSRRRYVLRTIRALERIPPEHKHPANQPPTSSTSDSRVA